MIEGEPMTNFIFIEVRSDFEMAGVTILCDEYLRAWVKCHAHSSPFERGLRYIESSN